VSEIATEDDRGGESKLPQGEDLGQFCFAAPEGNRRSLPALVVGHSHGHSLG
jgi:hypothetical protein